MSVTRALPRLTGVLGALWAVRLLPGALGTPPPENLLWTGALALWVGACLALIRLDHIRIAAGVLAALSLALMPVLQPQDSPELALMAWFGLILAVTEGRPAERALLIRTCVTTVYAFAALTKLNPVFVGGDQIANVITTRPQLQFLAGATTTTAVVSLALLTILIEGWLAVGLWFSSTQRWTAALGVVFHLVLLVSAPRGTLWGFALLVLLNGLLVVGYIAFFDRGTADSTRRVAWAAS